MCRDGAESTAAEAATVEIDREFDHLESRDGLSLIFRVWQTRVGEVKGMIDLLLRHGREHGIADDIARSAIGRCYHTVSGLSFYATHILVGGIVS